MMEALAAASGGSVQGVACDITTPEGRAQALAACPAPDILVNNAGGPPPAGGPGAASTLAR
jgi:3-oxoacyl-[acyl-carrier protein] reductase